jgi:hypothetical protein
MIVSIKASNVSLTLEALQLLPMPAEQILLPPLLPIKHRLLPVRQAHLPVPVSYFGSDIWLFWRLFLTILQSLVIAILHYVSPRSIIITFFFREFITLARFSSKVWL